MHMMDMLLRYDELGLTGVNGVIHVGAHEAEELEGYVEQGIQRVLWVEANCDRYDAIIKKIGCLPEMHLG